LIGVLSSSKRLFYGHAMSSFDGDWWERQRIALGIAGQLTAIGALRGRAELHEQQAPQVLNVLRQVALIQSTESSNRIEGITVPEARLRSLVAEKSRPRNRSEAEVAGYRDVLATIHASARDIPVRPSVIRQLHRDLFQYASAPGGIWKAADNLIATVRPDGTREVRFVPVPAVRTEEAMSRLCDGYAERAGTIEPLLLIPAFVLDFLCIHPFTDGNGRMARLLTLLLLYQHGYSVGRFISLERVIEESKESYYDALYASSQGWHEGLHDSGPWWSYWLGTILAAYREFEERAGLLTGRRGAKTELVLDAIRRMPGEFTIRDLRRVLPDVSIDMIRKLLAHERQKGRLACSRRGPSAVWRRV
jgi:Fic family protein